MSKIVEITNNILRDRLTSAVTAAIAAGDLPEAEMPQFNIEIPANKDNGDYSSNIAMAGARAFRKAPAIIADAIVRHLDLSSTLFERVEIAGPGFLNFFLSQSYYSEILKDVFACGDEYGRSDYGQGKRILVEFVSANPTGPMHIGNARGGAIGDCLASLLQEAGYTADREFYINDAGNQISKFGKSLSLRYMQICGADGQKIVNECGNDTEKFTAAIYGDTATFPMPEDVYLGQDIIEHSKNFYDMNGDKFAGVSEEDRKSVV